MKHSPRPVHDVIVIGGGFAGVTAARDCMKNGWRTVIVEGRERLGGRTHSTSFAGHTIEMGGTWIHWSQPFVWVEKERYGLALAETPDGIDPHDKELVVCGSGARHVLRGEQMRPVLAAFEAFFADAREIWERPFDSTHGRQRLLAVDGLSARQRLASMQLGEVERLAVEGLMSGLANGSSAEVSYPEVARWWSLGGWSFQSMDDAAGRYRLADGTGALIEAMVADGQPELRLGFTVTRIQDLGERVVVTGSRGESIEARCAIIALPMNCLPDVVFEPPLAAQVIEAGRERHAGRGLKVVAKVAPDSCARGKQLALADESHPINIAFTYARREDHCLFVGFGADASALDLTDRDAVERALRRLFPQLRVLEHTAHDWSADPFSQGTWADYKTGWYARYQPHFQQDRDRLLFAQGDHGEGWRGFIDGAIGAGVKAAQRARALLT